MHSEAFFVGSKGLAYHSISFGRVKEKLLTYSTHCPPRHRKEVTQIKRSRIVWDILEFNDGRDGLDVRVERLIPIVERAYRAAVG
jgi:hypothetical protein